MKGQNYIPMRYENQRKAWEKEYRGNRVLWRGEKDWSEMMKYFEKSFLILDLGSGQGKSSKYLIERGYNVIMMDFSMNALRNLKFQRVLGNALSMPFKDESFDAVLAIHVISHVFDRKRIMNEIERVTKKNGYIFVEVFSVEDFRYGKGIEVERNTFLRGNGIITHYFYENEMEDFLWNFKIIERKKYLIKRKIFNKIYNMVTLFFIGKKR